MLHFLAENRFGALLHLFKTQLNSFSFNIAYKWLKVI